MVAKKAVKSKTNPKKAIKAAKHALVRETAPNPGRTAAKAANAAISQLAIANRDLNLVKKDFTVIEQKNLLLSAQLAQVREDQLPFNHIRSPYYSHPGEFVDGRGAIVRLTDKSVGSVQLITSKKGSMRASHFHKEDGHLCTVVYGHIAYYERPVQSPSSIDAPLPVRYDFKEGESFITGPDVEHEMWFLEDTAFVCMANRHRTPAEYEKDLVRLPFPLKGLLQEPEPEKDVAPIKTDPAVLDKQLADANGVKADEEIPF